MPSAAPKRTLHITIFRAPHEFCGTFSVAVRVVLVKTASSWGMVAWLELDEGISVGQTLRDFKGL